ncbi:MAG: hypothetical protein M4579_000058 [Chaenotheca gracillima]|nr:MAG: hypothetical protein M4579_000058 [Chaenotheca gracillima]
MPKQWDFSGSDDEDSISLTSTAPSEEREEYPLEEVLAESTTAEDVPLYLVKWQDYPISRSTWEPVRSFVDGTTLKEWEEKKQRIENGEEEPFDLDAFDAELEALEQETNDRKTRRAAKRKRMRTTQRRRLGKGRGRAKAKTNDKLGDFIDSNDDEEPPQSGKRDRAPKEKSKDPQEGDLPEPGESDDSFMNELREKHSKKQQRKKGKRRESLKEPDSSPKGRRAKQKKAPQFTEEEDRLAKEARERENEETRRLMELPAYGPIEPSAVNANPILYNDSSSRQRSATGSRNNGSVGAAYSGTAFGPNPSGTQAPILPRKGRAAVSSTKSVRTGLAKKSGPKNVRSSVPSKEVPIGRGGVMRNWNAPPPKRNRTKPTAETQYDPSAPIFNKLSIKRKYEKASRNEPAPNLEGLQLFPADNRRQSLPKIPSLREVNNTDPWVRKSTEMDSRSQSPTKREDNIGDISVDQDQRPPSSAQSPDSSREAEIAARSDSKEQNPEDNNQNTATGISPDIRSRGVQEPTRYGGYNMSTGQTNLPQPQRGNTESYGAQSKPEIVSEPSRAPTAPMSRKNSEGGNKKSISLAEYRQRQAAASTAANQGLSSSSAPATASTPAKDLMSRSEEGDVSVPAPGSAVISADVGKSKASQRQPSSHAASSSTESQSATSNKPLAPTADPRLQGQQVDDPSLRDPRLRGRGAQDPRLQASRTQDNRLDDQTSQATAFTVSSTNELRSGEETAGLSRVTQTEPAQTDAPETHAPQHHASEEEALETQEVEHERTVTEAAQNQQVSAQAQPPRMAQWRVPGRVQLPDIRTMYTTGPWAGGLTSAIFEPQDETPLPFMERHSSTWSPEETTQAINRILDRIMPIDRVLERRAQLNAAMNAPPRPRSPGPGAAPINPENEGEYPKEVKFNGTEYIACDLEMLLPFLDLVKVEKTTFFLAFPFQDSVELETTRAFLTSEGHRVYASDSEDEWELFRVQVDQERHGVILIHNKYDDIAGLKRLDRLLLHDAIRVFQIASTFSETDPVFYENTPVQFSPKPTTYLVDNMFPNGGMVLFTESLIYKHPAAAWKVMRWFLAINHRYGNDLWKLVGLPSFKDFVLNRAEQADREQIGEVEERHDVWRVWMGLDNLLNDPRFVWKPSVPGPDGEPQYITWPESPVQWPNLPPEWTEWTKDYFLQWYAGWTLTFQNFKHRHFIAVEPEAADLDVVAKWGHCDIVTPQEFFEVYGAFVTEEELTLVDGSAFYY